MGAPIALGTMYFAQAEYVWIFTLWNGLIHTVSINTLKRENMYQSLKITLMLGDVLLFRLFWGRHQVEVVASLHHQSPDRSVRDRHVILVVCLSSSSAPAWSLRYCWQNIRLPLPVSCRHMFYIRHNFIYIASNYNFIHYSLCLSTL